MPKTKRLTTYFGSMLEPLCQYVKNLDVVVTPYDPVGNKIAKHVYTYYKGGSPMLKQLDSRVRKSAFTRSCAQMSNFR